MLSGESAQGDYPYEAVSYMAKIDEKAEEDIDHAQMINNVVDCKEDMTEADAVGLAVASISAVFDFPCTVAEGNVELALALSQYRPATDIFFACDNADDCRTLSVLYGINAVLGNIDDALAKAKSVLGLTSDDQVLAVSGKKVEIVDVK